LVSYTLNVALMGPLLRAKFQPIGGRLAGVTLASAGQQKLKIAL